VDAELGIDLHEQVDVIGRDLDFDQLGAGLGNHIPKNRLESLVHAIDQYRTPELRASDDAVFTRIDDVLIALVVHSLNIQAWLIEFKCAFRKRTVALYPHA
jgi:hypothetical protein